MSTKKIALMGGSFNPPHPGHFEMAKHVHAALGADEVWLLFSQNPHKDPARYAPLPHRIAMAKLLQADYPGVPLVFSDIEEELKTHITADVLAALSARYPDHNFTWVMGADNLIGFHTWERYEDIIQNFAVAVVDRPPYTEQAKASFTALTYAHLQAADAQDIAQQGKGWAFFDNPGLKPGVAMASSQLLAEMRAGRRDFDGPFQRVADYIVEHGLLGIGAIQANAQPAPSEP